MRRIWLFLIGVFGEMLAGIGLSMIGFGLFSSAAPHLGATLAGLALIGSFYAIGWFAPRYLPYFRRQYD